MALVEVEDDCDWAELMASLGRDDEHGGSQEI